MPESASPRVAEMSFRVRPFELTFDAPPSGAVKSTGMIAGSHFVLSFDLHDYEVPIVQLGHDEFGPYAEVLEQEIKNPDGSVLTVSTEVDESFGETEIGCRISVSWPNRRTIEMRKQVDDQLVEQGTWPSDVNVIYPTADQSLCVHFGPTGYVDGGGSSSCGVPVTEISKERGH